MSNTLIFFTKKEAEKCRWLIDMNLYPYQRKYIIAMKRLLTDAEFKKLCKNRGKHGRNKNRL